MRLLKLAGIALLAYVALVVVFETFLGTVQPSFEMKPGEEWGSTIRIATIGKDGSRQERMVTPMISKGQLYVSANHWPRSWYNRVLENPEVQITNRNETKDYRAVPIDPASEEHAQVQQEHPHSFGFRFMTGFPPRRFVRFEPR